MRSQGVLHRIRQAIREGEAIDDSTEGMLKIGSNTYAMTDLTEYTGRKGQGAYDLDSIWFMYQNGQTGYSDYMRATGKTGKRMVLLNERRDLLSWLNGKIDRIDGIKEEVSVDEPVPEPEPEPEPEPVEEEVVEQDEQEPEPAPIEVEAPVFVDRGPIVEYERIRPLDSVILGTHDFSDVLTMHERFQRERQSEPRYNDARADATGEQSFIFPTRGPTQQKGKFSDKDTYIILVSRSNKSRINNTNIESFLKDSQWVPPKVDATQRPFKLIHRHSVTMHAFTYNIVANEDLLEGGDWDRVVAVFLTGQQWQIKKYKPNDPALLFQRMLGIYVGWDNETRPQEIANWRVKEVKINMAKRHGDPQAVANIWHDIEDATTTLKKRLAG